MIAITSGREFNSRFVDHDSDMPMRRSQLLFEIGRRNSQCALISLKTPRCRTAIDPDTGAASDVIELSTPVCRDKHQTLLLAAICSLPFRQFVINSASESGARSLGTHIRRRKVFGTIHRHTMPANFGAGGRGAGGFFVLLVQGGAEQVASLFSSMMLTP